MRNLPRPRSGHSPRPAAESVAGEEPPRPRSGHSPRPASARGEAATRSVAGEGLRSPRKAAPPHSSERGGGITSAGGRSTRTFVGVATTKHLLQLLASELDSQATT